MATQIWGHMNSLPMCNPCGRHLRASAAALSTAHASSYNVKCCTHAVLLRKATSVESPHQHRRAEALICMAHPRRIARVSSQIQREIGDMLANDPVVMMGVCPERRAQLVDAMTAVVSITSVEVSSDLQVAKVFVSIYSDPLGKRRALRGLKRLEPYIRREIGHRMRLKRTPEIRFEYDETNDELDMVQKALGKEEIERFQREIEQEQAQQATQAQAQQMQQSERLQQAQPTGQAQPFVWAFLQQARGTGGVAAGSVTTVGGRQRVEEDDDGDDEFELEGEAADEFEHYQADEEGPVEEGQGEQWDEEEAQADSGAEERGGEEGGSAWQQGSQAHASSSSSSSSSSAGNGIHSHSPVRSKYSMKQLAKQSGATEGQAHQHHNRGPHNSGGPKGGAYRDGGRQRQQGERSYQPGRSPGHGPPGQQHDGLRSRKPFDDMFE